MMTITIRLNPDAKSGRETANIRAHPVEGCKFLAVQRSVRWNRRRKTYEPLRPWYVVTHIPTGYALEIHARKLTVAKSRAAELGALVDRAGRSIWNFKKIPKHWRKTRACSLSMPLITAWEEEAKKAEKRT